MNTIDIQKSKARLAGKARRQDVVKTLSPDAAAADLIQYWPSLSTRGKSIAGFWPIHDEIDVRPLLSALQSAGQVTALPRIVRKAKPLGFHIWNGTDALERGAYGTAQPAKTAPQINPQIVLVPMLAFTASGLRLGYGGGFYDRTLAALRSRALDTGDTVFACGVAYSGQETDFVPTDAYDQKLDGVLTEAGFRTFT